MSEVQIAFLGATDTVTGSRFLISSGQSKILVDCGLFQGVKAVQRRNWDPIAVNAKEIDAVVLTHAHLDHSGYLPLLVKQGFHKEIYATRYTKDLTKIILRDSARLQTADAKFAAKRGYSEHKNPAPLYTEEDAEKAIDHLRERAFHVREQIAPDAFVTFYPSGHILGSSFVVVEVGGKSFLFTSDLGRNNHPLLSNPDLPPQQSFDVIVTESTYGDRLHETSEEAFALEINAAIDRGGAILIPAFAVDRTEVILMSLNKLIEAKQIPQIPIYVDSPMALSALNLYREAIGARAPEIREGVTEQFSQRDPFDAGGLHQLESAEESKAINDIDHSAIIISASGMASGGRVVHHLANMLPNPKHTVILVGYQAVGSRGRLLEEGAQQVKIHGEFVPVNAHIAKVESFSVHADSNELIQWLGKAAKPKHAYVVHGEATGQSNMQQRLTNELGWDVTVPKTNEIFEV